MKIFTILTSLVARSLAPMAACAAEFHAPPWTYRTSWIGNTFGGDGGPNGFGYWVENGAVWVIVGKTVRHFSKSGAALEGEITTLGKPRAISFDQQGRLIVCDDGPDQQVKFFDVRATP